MNFLFCNSRTIDLKILKKIEESLCKSRLAHLHFIRNQVYSIRINEFFIEIGNIFTEHSSHYLRNRKHSPCFYRVIETRMEVWENEKCRRNTSRRRVFPQPFRVLPNLHECFYNSIETRRKYFLFLLENSPRKIRENEENLIVLFIIKT